jgi:two-component system OmpR family sensor kinase
LLASEKRTILYVILLYISSTLLLILSLSYFYYHIQKNEIIQNAYSSNSKVATQIVSKLKSLEENYLTKSSLEYPKYKEYQTAIYDIDKNIIFSQIDNKISIDLNKNSYSIDGNYIYIQELSNYYLGAKYLVILSKLKTPLSNLKNEILIFALIASIIIFATSLLIAKIILKPLRDSVKLLDNFIKDTTHELNTPIATILANIESVKLPKDDFKNLKRLQRVKIASLTISNLYQDLVYLTLNHKVLSQPQNLEVSSIIKERVEHFKIIIEGKRLHLTTNIEEPIYLFIDKNKFIRVIDNIISNAIKYNRVNGDIIINAKKSYISIKDSGRGMTQEEISKIFNRYERFDSSVGGFGIGYSIVKSIIDEFNIKIEINSELSKGSEVILRW